MQLSWRLLLFVVLALGALFYLGSSGAKLAVGSVDLTLSSTTVSPGDTFTATVSVTSEGYYPALDCYSSTTSNNYCNASNGSCPVPCRSADPTLYDTFNTYGYMGAHFVDQGGSYVGYYDGTYFVYSIGPGQLDSSAVDFYQVNSRTSPSQFDGLRLEPGGKIRFAYTLSTQNGTGIISLKGVVFYVCYDSSLTAPTVTINTSGWTYWRTHTGSWYGRNWTCKLYYNNTTRSYTNIDAYVSNNGSGISVFYVGFASRCFFDSAYCPNAFSDNMKVNPVVVAPVNSGLVQFEVSAPSGISCGTCQHRNATSATFNCSVTSSASSGTYTITGAAVGEGARRVLLWPPDDVVYNYCGYETSDPWLIGTDTASLTVQTPATSVVLYSYGSNSGSPSQEPDDHFVQGRIYVSGGTLFDRVDLYVDGSSAASYSRSTFTCGTSYCYKDFSLSFNGKSDGPHTLEARLIVNGSLRDTDQKTVYYYQVGVRNVVASQAGNDNVSVSFEYKGGHSAYKIYIDSPSCIVAQNTNFRPSSAHDWQTFGPQSFTIPSCARTPGTHTLYVELSDESGLSDTASTTVDFSFTYTYSVSLDQPVAGTKHLQTDVLSSPPSTYEEPFSISYSTDDPNATLKLLVNGSQVQSWTVTGSGVKSGTVPSNYLQCGDAEFLAELSGSSGSDQSSVVVRYVCWYASIESPKGTVDVPSADNVTVNDGTTLTLLAITDETPQDLPKVVNAYLDGSPLSPVSCPSGYTDCFAVPVGGLSCGSTHTLSLEVGDGVTVYANDSESITLNCVQRYVDIVSPADGSEFDFNVPLSEVNLDVYVNYAGGTSLTFQLNGSPIELIESSDGCSYSACYILPGSELSVGDNNLTVYLLDESNNVLASDTSAFRVNLWQFIVGEDWGVTPPLLYVEEHGSHPDGCSAYYDSNVEPMVYDSDLSRWLLPIDESFVGKSVVIRCTYSTRTVYEVNYTVQGYGAQPAAPVVVGGGGGGTVTISRTVAFPVFPERRTAANYIYSVYHFAGVEPSRNLKDVYISQGMLCIVPRAGESVSLTYYRYNFGSFPEDDTAARQIFGRLTPDMIERVKEVRQGGAFCYEIPGTGVYDLKFDDGEYYVLVLDISETAGGINLSLAVVGLIVLVLIVYMALGRSNLGV